MTLQLMMEVAALRTLLQIERRKCRCTAKCDAGRQRKCRATAVRRRRR